MVQPQQPLANFSVGLGRVSPLEPSTPRLQVRYRGPVPRRVRDDWPVRVPVTGAELDVLDVHFGDVLDRLLAS